MDNVIALIIKREELKKIKDEIENEKKAVDAKIEEVLGDGTHHVGSWVVTCGTHIVSRFNSSDLKKQFPELAIRFSTSTNEHFFQIRKAKEKNHD